MCKSHIFDTFLFAEGLFKNKNTFEYVIQSLTSEFIASILMTIIVIIIYLIITSIKKTAKND